MQSKFFTPFLFLILALAALPAVGQTPFYTESFSDETASLAAWTAGGTNEGTETWKWNNNVAYNRYGGVNFAAPTAADGYLVFDSDANGLNNDHTITLTSPVIDCSGKSQVFLELYTQYIYYNYGYSQIELGVSTDGTTFNYQEILDETEAGYIYAGTQRTVVEIPAAANQATVYLQLRWRGNYEYYLLVDDVALYDTAPILPNELSIFNVSEPSAYRIPLSQVDSILFIAMTSNNGADPQTNVRMRVSILNEAGDLVYQDSTESTPTLAAGALDTFFIETGGFLPAALGEYLVIQSVIADEDDDFLGNNRKVYGFEVTEDLFTIDDDDFQFYGIGLPAEFNADNWEGGSYFYVPNGEEFEAHNAQFMVYSEDDTHIGKTITILLYKAKEFLPFQATNNDVEVVGFSNYTFTADDESFTLINAPLFQDDGETVGIALEDSSEYVLLLSLPQDVGIPFTIRDLVYDFGSIVRNGSDWFTGGFSGPLALVVRMGIRPKTATPTKEPVLSDSRINAFPNPATDTYNIDLDLESSSPVQLQLMNTSGQVVKHKEYQALQQSRINFDINDLVNGTYLIKVRTDEGVKTLKLIKQ